MGRYSADYTVAEMSVASLGLSSGWANYGEPADKNHDDREQQDGPLRARKDGSTSCPGVRSQRAATPSALK
jgi:hypothetical protein